MYMSSLLMTVLVCCWDSVTYRVEMKHFRNEIWSVKLFDCAVHDSIIATTKHRLSYFNQVKRTPSAIFAGIE